MGYFCNIYINGCSEPALTIVSILIMGIMMEVFTLTYLVNKLEKQEKT